MGKQDVLDNIARHFVAQLVESPRGAACSFLRAIGTTNLVTSILVGRRPGPRCTDPS